MRKKIREPNCQQLIDSFPDPFVVIDRNYTIVTANRRYAKHYGEQADALIGRRCHEVSHRLDSPCSQHGEHCPLEELFRTGEPGQVMHVHYDGEGNAEQVQINATPLFDEQGKLQFMGETIIPVRNRSTESFVMGLSDGMQLVAKQAQRVAPTRTTVLVVGESGTGKECLARYIHENSDRSDGPFVVFDCAGSGSGEELERCLFGQLAPEGGPLLAQGVFQQAGGGTLFIDGLCELPESSQIRLLRALECGEIKPLGATDFARADVRVIVASVGDMREQVDSGILRKDLYYRLSAFPIQLPPLRERRKDIIPLARHFLKQLHEGGGAELTPEMEQVLLGHHYPGNVRELRNLIERALIYAADGPLRPEHLVFDHLLFAEDADRLARRPVLDESTRRLVDKRGSGPSPEEMLQVLEECSGHRSKAAQRLGISERTLYRRLKKLRAID